MPKGFSKSVRSASRAIRSRARAASAASSDTPIFFEYLFADGEMEDALVPGLQTPVCLVPRVKAGHQHPSVHHQRRQAPSRTLRSASPTIRSTSPALPRLGRAALRATASSLRVGGLIGRTSSPSSPRSNTLTGPPRPKPTRSHQSWGEDGLPLFRQSHGRCFHHSKSLLPEPPRQARAAWERRLPAYYGDWGTIHPQGRAKLPASSGRALPAGTLPGATRLAVK